VNRSTLVIADDHKLLTELCRSLLEPEFNVVATVSDGHALVRAAVEFKPSVIVADIGMPLLNGLDAAEEIKRLMPAVRVVFLTMDNSTDLAAEAFRRGASAYLHKTCASNELVIAVRRVLRGLSYLSPSIDKNAVEFLVRKNRAMVSQDQRLTERQREVLQLLAEGSSMKRVADVLNISVRTVAFHKYKMMEVLGTKSSAELVQYAMRNHMIAS
jgi:DNA-binding NarL/FixJ family response regulator